MEISEELTPKECFDVAPSTAAECLPVPASAWVYLLRCPDGSLYCGWTNNLAKRLKAHNGGKAGAKYTRMKGQGKARLVYAERCADKSAALKREYAVKQFSKEEKERLAEKWQAENKITVRPATPEDAEAVTEIYNWYVTHSTASYQYPVSAAEEYHTRIAEIWENAPFLAAVTDSGRLMGYAYAHPLYARESYRWAVETTVYCAPDAVGQGVGKKLYTALLEILRRQGYHEAFALVASTNAESHAFHKSLGFTKAGNFPHIAYKFGEWLGLAYWRLSLHPITDNAPPTPVRKKLPKAELEEVLRQVNQK